MACVEKLGCPDCGSSDSLQVFHNQNDTFSSFCFGSCYEYKGNPYRDGKVPEFKEKTKAEIFEEIKEIQKSGLFAGLGAKKEHRGIPGSFFKSWGVRLLLSEYDGITPYAVGFPYSNEGKLSGWKVATLEKKGFWSLGNTKDSDPFGFERAMKLGGKRLYITEGEYDAIALDYCLVQANKSSKYGKKGYPVISLSAGGGSITKNLKKIRKRIKNRFDEIVLVLDNDEVGLKAEKEAQKLLPDVLRADKPQGCKDANDAVKKGLMFDMAKMAQWDAHKPPIDGIVRVADVLDKAMEAPVMGLSYPWEDLTEMTYGQRFGEAVCLGAGVGLGKTVTAHCMMAWNMTVHKHTCFAVLLEEANVDTVRNVCAKIDKIPYNNPRAQYDPDRLKDTASKLQNKLILWESEGDQYLRFDMDEIIEAVRFNVAEYGVKFVYLDNFTRLVDHLDPGEANAFINKYSSVLENLAAQLDIHIMCYTHLNPPKFGPSHEEGAEVYASQFTGSRGIMRSFPMLMSFRRNKHPEGGRSANNSIISVIKNRKYGSEGQVRTKYQPNTGDLISYDWEGDLMNEEKKRGR